MKAKYIIVERIMTQKKEWYKGYCWGNQGKWNMNCGVVNDQ